MQLFVTRSNFRYSPSCVSNVASRSIIVFSLSWAPRPNPSINRTFAYAQAGYFCVRAHHQCAHSFTSAGSVVAYTACHSTSPLGLQAQFCPAPQHVPPSASSHRVPQFSQTHPVPSQSSHAISSSCALTRQSTGPSLTLRPVISALAVKASARYFGRAPKHIHLCIVVPH